MKPFIKWAGGKTQILSVLKENLPENYNNYYEPFLGGGALFLDLMPKNAVINDLNSDLINCYYQIRDNLEELIQLIHEFQKETCNKEFYLRMRDLYNKKIHMKNFKYDVETAALFIWLNKHCFNGLYRLNSKGEFNVPFNQNNSLKSIINDENLREISNFLRNNNIIIRNTDFKKALFDVKSGDFVYFDSPYVPISKTANFVDYTKTGFKWEDHLRLFNLVEYLTENNVNVMLSNNYTEDILKLYKNYQIKPIKTRRSINSIGSKRVSEEVIITNY